MNSNNNELTLIEHRYRTEFPYPIASAFARVCTPSALKVQEILRLMSAAEEVVRYAAIVAASDYIAHCQSDESGLKSLRKLWIVPQGASFGKLYERLTVALKLLRKRPEGVFVPEFAGVQADALEKAVAPLIAARNDLIHGQGHDFLDYHDFIDENRGHLMNLVAQFAFLSKYQMCVADPGDDDAGPSPGEGQVLKLCRGSSGTFGECVVTPYEPVRPGTVFIWNSAFTEMLTLAPFLVYGRVVFDENDMQRGRNQTPMATSFEGLLRLETHNSYKSLEGDFTTRIKNFARPTSSYVTRLLKKSFHKDSGVTYRRSMAIGEADRDKFGGQDVGCPGQLRFVGAKESYVVQRQPVGRGGMAVVYLVTGESSSGMFAVKAMTPELESVGKGALARRFAHEHASLETLDALGNENIVRLVDSGQQEVSTPGGLKSCKFIVLEYVSGGTLEDDLSGRLDNRPPYSYSEALAIVKGVANGLAAVHTAGIVHRDMKPGNILLARSQEATSQDKAVVAKITDFGLAIERNRSSDLLSNVAGTLDYMAREQFEENGPAVGPEADIYALGKILCHMLTGVLPQNAAEAARLDFPVATGESTGAGEAFPVEGVRQVIVSALADIPEDRFATVEDFVDALDNAGEVERAISRLDKAQVTDAQVRSAFALAATGYGRLRASLIRWCADDSEARHDQAAVAISALDGDAPREIASQAEAARTDRVSDRRTYSSLIAALAAILAVQEASQPRLGAQPWLDSLSNESRRKVRNAFVLNNLNALKGRIFRTLSLYVGCAAFCSGLFWVPAGFFAGSVFWGTEPASMSRAATIIWLAAVSIMPGTIWGSFFPAAFLVARCLPRPGRLFVMGALLAVASLVSTGLVLLIWGDIEPVRPRDYFLGFGIAVSIPLAALFILKETPIVAKRLPSKLFSLLMVPLFVGLPCIIFGLTFSSTAISRHQALGSSFSGLGLAFGIGLADYLTDMSRR